MTGETVTKNREDAWYWDEADPKTLTVIGALSKPPKGLFSMDKRTIDAASHGFPGLDASEISSMDKTMRKAHAEITGEDYDDEPEAIPRAIVNQLHECEPEHMRAVLQELGELAGGTREIAKLELLTGDQIEKHDQYAAIPALQHLSQLAIDRVATVEDRGMVYPAPGPNGTDAHYFFRHDLIGN